MRKLRNTEAEMKKNVAFKKKRVAVCAYTCVDTFPYKYMSCL